MKVTRVLVFVLCLFAVTASAGVWPNFGGTFYSGTENVDLLLTEKATDWSIPDIVHHAWWDARISSNGATLTLCRFALMYDEDGDLTTLLDSHLIAPGDGCIDLTWDPNAHAYVWIGDPFQGMAPAKVLVVTPNIVKLVEGEIVDGAQYNIFCTPPLWVWEHERMFSIGVGAKK